jgi:hypothetical protein
MRMGRAVYVTSMEFWWGNLKKRVFGMTMGT